MPKLNDITAIAESIGSCPVFVIEENCAAVRNRQAKCRACVKACPVEAIEVSSNEITVKSSVCIGCGICATVCPTEALRMLEPTDDELATVAVQSLAANDGMAVFACARIASKRLADPERYAEVPCLSRLNESLLLEQVAQGASQVVLVDGKCSTCKYRVCVSSIDAVAAQADELLAAHGSPVRIERTSAFPEMLLVDDPSSLHGSSRRGFFHDVRGAAKDAAFTAAKTTIAQELGIDLDKRPPLAERLRAQEDGALPYVSAPRHERAINALDQIGAPCVDTISSRLFGCVNINLARCISCGMCAVFCPTGALRRDPTTNASDSLRYLEFSACECVQCHLCVDVCWKRCLTMSADVPAEQLYDFEPRVFTVPKNWQKKVLI